MKNLLLYILLVACTSTKKPFLSPDVKEDYFNYEVSKIDSLNTYYFIYLKRNDSAFKLLSKKELAFNCQKIEPKHKYRFELVSIWNQPIIINGLNVSPSTTPHVTCLGLDDSTNVCLERNLGINDIFYAKNLSGLCVK